MPIVLGEIVSYLRKVYTQLNRPTLFVSPPPKVMKICMNPTGVNKIEQTDKLLLETLHEIQNASNRVLKLASAFCKIMLLTQK